MTEPLTPAGADLRDFPFTPIFRARLFGSSFHARSTDAEWRAGVTLWLKSWDQVPAGSLPNDETDLCRLAELGRDTKTWRKIKDGALRGWVECSDGRLYHEVVAQGVNDALDNKRAQRIRTASARIAKLKKKLEETTDAAEKHQIQEHIDAAQEELSQWMSQRAQKQTGNSVTGSVTDSVTDNVTGSKGREETETVEGNLRKKDDAAPPPSAKDRLWSEGPAAIAALAGGKDPDEFRSVIGGWLKAKHTPEQIIAAISKAQAEKAIDPVPYIVACLRQGAGPKGELRTVPRHEARRVLETAGLGQEPDPSDRPAYRDWKQKRESHLRLQGIDPRSLVQ